MHIQEWLAQTQKEHYGVITGASSGIGKCFAQRLAKEGIPLLLVSENQGELEATADELRQEGAVRIETYVANFFKPAEVRKLAKFLTQKKISIFVNNAGIGMKGLFHTNSAEAYNQLININIAAMTTLMHAVLPGLQQQNYGLVINVSSINSLVSIPHNQVYTASKAYVTSFARALAYENQDTKIIFQLLLPGTTDTPFHTRQDASPQMGVMLPDDVARISLESVGVKEVIPNKADWLVPLIARIVPTQVAMRIAVYALKMRLGVK
ncbi:MAG: SDR family NAD(P)-dependent oxidoreductase [Zetaproteobacteria bacterium]|nr:SDR family NAD(P)-dependent oxidoreductase [Zetaproteobacteria bacterium]